MYALTDIVLQFSGFVDNICKHILDTCLSKDFLTEESADIFVKVMLANYYTQVCLRWRVPRSAFPGLYKKVSLLGQAFDRPCPKKFN